VVELPLEHHDLALDLVPVRFDDIEALIQDQLVAGPGVMGVDGGVEIDLQPPALGQDGDRAIFVLGQVHSVGRGWGAELVHFRLQGRRGRADERLQDVQTALASDPYTGIAVSLM